LTNVLILVSNRIQGSRRSLGPSPKDVPVFFLKMLDSTIAQMPYVVVVPVIPVLWIMFYWLFRVYKGKAILRSLHPF
ncbi:MAG: hypothetical protein AB2705_21115, partial [Candidatus Thiodiazotropha sp.]